MDFRRVAYFSMEIALDPAMPTYSGGLGVLAGDTIRAAADMRVPMVGVSLLHRKGYFKQSIDAQGLQTESPADWNIREFVDETDARVVVEVEGRQVHVRAWKRDVIGITGHTLPVYLLDTDLPENGDYDRSLTHWLYGGDWRYRLAQEIVLGIGGVRMLEALGYDGLRKYHMNEGHAALLTLELLDRHARETGRDSIEAADMEAVRCECVFTTHTPVPAGHDKFPKGEALHILGRGDLADIREFFTADGSELNMTLVALNLSHYVNGVAKRHGLVSRDMFAGHTVDAITNGVHAQTWVSPAFAQLFGRYIPGWPEDNFSLRYALEVPPDEIWAAHQEQKSALLRVVRDIAGVEMKGDVLTIGFARRMTAYKRPDLILRDLERLRRLAKKAGPIQLIFAGKAHPRDGAGKGHIHAILEARRKLGDDVKIAFLPNYGIELGRLMTAGVDVWLNNPVPPLEASGTSGMKAALNGVPSLSTLDGWWLEGCIEGVTGWSIGSDEYPNRSGDHDAADADALFAKLESAVMPTYYDRREKFVDIMRHCIALNGSFFNTQRMIQEYVVKAYFADGHPRSTAAADGRVSEGAV